MQVAPNQSTSTFPTSTFPTSTSPMFEKYPAKNEDRPRKKARKAKSNSNDSDLQPCYLSKLPFELLAEILLFTASPRDILAVSRCSKFFCATLLNPSSTFIWRHLRRSCQPGPLPDPIPMFTESSYAAFVFDGGECEMCKRWVTAPYASFSLRIRLCGRLECMETVESTMTYISTLKTAQYPFLKWMPVVESSVCFSPETETYKPLRVWPKMSACCRTPDWLRETDQYNAAVTDDSSMKAYLTKREREIRPTKLWMKFCVTLLRWRVKRRFMYRAVKTRNEIFANSLAKEKGWQSWDLLNSPTFGALHRNRTNILEDMTKYDLAPIMSVVEAELLNLAEHRKRSAYESAYRQRRADVEKHYNRLRSDRVENPLPNLSTFRQLPIIHSLQSQTSSDVRVTKSMEEFSTQEMLHDQLETWREQARSVLGTTLGYSDWKAPSSTKLHPVERLTARFQCQKCERVATKYREDECLDFAGVCAHECIRSKDKPKTKVIWSADQFIKDDKAIAAISQVLELCGADVEDAASFDIIKTLGVRIMCQSCSSAILMGFESVFGHSHRHDSMQVSLLSQSEADAILTNPHEYGRAKRLMGPEHKAKELRNLPMYGCRHCVQSRTPSGTSRSEKPAIFNFNGMRSHLKAKHCVDDIRDEDFFCLDEPVWKAPKNKELKKESNESQDVAKEVKK